MKITTLIDKHEMLRLWAIGEIYVDLLNPENRETALKHLSLLNAKDLISERKGIEQILKKHHWSLIDFIPEDTIWYKAILELNKPEFYKLNNLPVDDLGKITNNTFRVAYAANIIRIKPDLNRRISGIIDAMKKGEVQFSGITLLASEVNGPYTILEGNGRLISLYNLEFIEKLKVCAERQIEVVLGLSDAEIA
ncbi:hypothetical protein [Pedobacter sp. FW305-3-2-15-E-R2A2]|uniref:hypothetical protein n=1 Tax=Pedobacter sp. FW305-3-2-15-E-R2A2 TaxID=3140251 RepID=UPI0031404DF5